MFSSVIIIMAGVFAASILRGFTGFGFGLAGVPLLSLALPPAEVVPLVMTLQAAIGFLGLRGAMTDCDWRAVRLLFPGLVAGIPIGLLILTELPANHVRLLIGVIILVSVWVIRCGLRLPPSPSRCISFGVGLTSGIINGLASMGGPPVVVYLLARTHTPAQMRSTAIVYFMLASCTSLAPMIVRGLVTQTVLIWSAGSMPLLFVGSRLGTWAFHRAKPHHHRTVALATLTVLGLSLVGRVLLG